MRPIFIVSVTPRRKLIGSLSINLRTLEAFSVNVSVSFLRGSTTFSRNNLTVSSPRIVFITPLRPDLSPSAAPPPTAFPSLPRIFLPKCTTSSFNVVANSLRVGPKNSLRALAIGWKNFSFIPDQILPHSLEPTSLILSSKPALEARS